MPEPFQKKGVKLSETKSKGKSNLKRNIIVSWISKNFGGFDSQMKVLSFVNIELNFYF
jgi:hypothetical protein